MSSDDSSRRNSKDGLVNQYSPRVVDLLILVKAAPLPAKHNLEIVCTAGIDAYGNWYRLYPIPFRYLTSNQQFAKYQWIRVEVNKVLPQKDHRKESHNPKLSSITQLGKPLPTGKAVERKRLILPLVQQSVESLQDDYYKDGTSLGIIKPKKMIDFIAKQSDRDWTGVKAKVQSQLRLFGPQPKELDKVPYNFYYKFICDDDRCKKEHLLSIHDWELHALYYNLKTKYNYAEDKILHLIKSKFLDQMWGSSCKAPCILHM